MTTTEQRREELAERVIQSLDNGIVPWQRKELPDAPVQGAISGRSYSGLNALSLMERCAEKGYTDPRFITASEANKHGVYIGKGEKGVPLEHWVKDVDGEIKPRTYSVFNVQQLAGKNGNLPLPEMEKTEQNSLEKAAALIKMLKNAGVEMPPNSRVEDYREAIKKLTADSARESSFAQTVSPELLALRCSIASTAIMREAGIPVEQTEGLPLKPWAGSIKDDHSQLFRAVRDGKTLASSVLGNMTQGKEAELSQANKERAEAQKGQEIVSEAATIPRGLDSNPFAYPNADLSGVQESVLVASDKARTQVSDLRASASSRENSAGTGKLTEAMNAAKKHLGSNAVVTSAVPGKTYSGRIAGIIGDGPDRTAIQTIAGNRAILHDIRNISAESNIRVGEDVKLTADEQGYSAVQGKEEKHKNNKTQELLREGKKR